MLTEREQYVINECRFPHFGADIQTAWLDYLWLLLDINEDKYPTKERLSDLNKHTKSVWGEFEFIYTDVLLQQETNPLELEQEAWKLLSPLVKQHISDFGSYINDYTPETVNKVELLTNINKGWDLWQKWDIISNLYKVKDQKMWDEVEEREKAVKKLIQELQEEQSPKL